MIDITPYEELEKELVQLRISLQVANHKLEIAEAQLIEVKDLLHEETKLSDWYGSLVEEYSSVIEPFLGHCNKYIADDFLTILTELNYAVRAGMNAE